MNRVLIEMGKINNPYSGLGQFCLHLGMHLKQLQSQKISIDFYMPEPHVKLSGGHCGFIKQKAIHKIFPIRSSSYYVWHCLHQDSEYLPEHAGTKLILTIHDLNFLKKYSGIKKKIRFERLQRKVDRAHAITVISRHTEKTVRENLNTGNKEIHLIYNGNTLTVYENEPKPDFIFFDHYIFSIGIISEKKNFTALLPLLKHNPNLHLVIAGNKNSSYTQMLIGAAKESGVAARLHLPGEISDPVKYWLYKNCVAFVFPSMEEGFGLPVVEAMSLGKPVFLARQTSLPEVGGSEAYYWENFNPAHVTEIFKNGMREFAADINKKERSIAWTKQFSWSKAAPSYLHLYEKLCEEEI